MSRRRSRKNRKRDKPRQTNSASAPSSIVRSNPIVSVPMIDGTSDIHEPSCDWPNAAYEATVTETAILEWNVKHDLQNAHGIQSLIDTKDAAWAVEVRCPYTLYIDTIVSETSEPYTTVRLSHDQVGTGTIFIWAGVLTTKDCFLNGSETSWEDDRIPVAAGQWLAREAPIQVEHQAASPLVFRPLQDISPESSVTISTEMFGQDMKFVIGAHPDRISQLKTMPSLLGCWASALAMMPYQNEFDITETALGEQIVRESDIGNLIAQRLLQANVPLWNEEANWDSMRAATIFLPLSLPPQDKEDGADNDFID